MLLFLVFGALSNAMAQPAATNAALPYPTSATPASIDIGPGPSATTPISVTIALRLHNLNAAESLLTSLHTAGDPQFHQFLTADQFVARFAPTAADVATVVAALARYGLTAQSTTATTLKVTGLTRDMESAFGVTLHSYAVPAQQSAPGYTYYAPLSPATIPAEIAASVSAVVGLDTRPNFYPHRKVAQRKPANPQSASPAAAPGNSPGLWTVTDFANYYDVQPLYRRGVSGSGRTVGIMTLASFTSSDAFAYWSAVGLSVNPNRIQIVNVDGGPGAPSDASGSDETTLDVEQSGGIAPGARIIVYQAPNTNQGFVDVFASAIDVNAADTLSISWGAWEWLNNLENAPVTDPTTGRTVGSTQAIHELLVRAAIQGQTVFAASGDSGAYDANEFFPLPDSTRTLSVDYPASDPAITAAGGTTLAGVQEFCLNQACTTTFSVNVPHERAWSWDYLQGLCNALGIPDPVACGIFPVGDGGGVSILFTVPLYQLLLPGIQRSQPGQRLVDNGTLVYALPANYPGRNVPDVSFNADPDTGYVIYYTSSATHALEVDTFFGGTSFVAPQLAGVSALLGQYVGGHRIGLLNYPLYVLALTGQAYSNPGAPLHAIPYGNNWFYLGRNGYSPAAGLGTLDVWNFAKILH